MDKPLEQNTMEVIAQAKSRSTVCPDGLQAKDGIDEKAPSVRVDQESISKTNMEFDGQDGVKKIEAMTVVWTKPWLITAYVFVWVIFFVNSLQQQASFAWTPYVTSSFALHGLTAITGVVSNLVGGVSKLPLAKFIDVVGRPQGFLLMLIFTILALVLMVACKNVQTFAAAQVFYWTGMNGIGYVLDVFIADTSSMKNRALLMAFTTTPYISNTFAGPELGQRFLDDSTWRWGFGAFAIITPIMCVPFWTIFVVMMRRAKRQNIIVKEKTGRTFLESAYYYLIEFDVIGLLLIVAGFSLVLLPFSLVSYQREGWESPMIICMLVFGFVSLGLFAAWEKYLAPKTFFPFHLLTNRSVLAACVVFQLSVSKAGYINNIFNIVSCAWGVIIAIAIRKFDRFKWAMLIAIPINIVMTGLLIHFRAAGSEIAALVVVEVFNGIAGGTLVICEQLTVMSAVPHEHVAVALALLDMVTSVGGSIGTAISGAIWTNELPSKLMQYLPEETKGNATLIYASLVTQLEYEWGSPTREGIVKAYEGTQKLMVITGAATLVPCCIWVLFIKNFRLSEHKQKGGLVL
ncbi:uncharacterized protein L3040_003709 [Drepanopeziza brunnea f. sp. 'multigermtubi']|uniref:Siderophore iron transporter mirB n=1 Tax=Marssonina brunnea f. sp. multigermtubi (strain MB_m1) TaxID=1072389 RepID=K1WCK4_MARBU|nr:siderophore iron transporter mirB [Drepanopeziza brunnea f. sp. 'multigermtubi' MB_m1]EKD15090.1 siderophore iron transporter mirB [Drepanopeziza brunnea f. sp. 'multigermtubi' MB_m1]KAJ5046466.1 hypothetical protein L3040_003709 [Drepanopeziza brunnea f. sp. 'multigermtubi']